MAVRLGHTSQFAGSNTELDNCILRYIDTCDAYIQLLLDKTRRRALSETLSAEC